MSAAPDAVVPAPDGADAGGAGEVAGRLRLVMGRLGAATVFVFAAH